MEVYNFSGRLLADYNEYMDSNSDPGTRHWLLVNSFSPLALIISGYLAFCTYIGPMLMRRRQPFDLKNTLIAYNLANVAASVWLVSESLQSGWLGDYNFRCQPIDYSGSPKAARMRRACWVYFMCKLVELLETVFFVLRKKDKQVSHLHLYHHSIMPALSWIGVRFAPGGQATLGMLLNCVVHAVMYTYYFLAALGPQYHKYLWWKKHLTALQLKSQNQAHQVEVVDHHLPAPWRPHPQYKVRISPARCSSSSWSATCRRCCSSTATTPSCTPSSSASTSSTSATCLAVSTCRTTRVKPPQPRRRRDACCSASATSLLALKQRNFVIEVGTTVELNSTAFSIWRVLFTAVNWSLAEDFVREVGRTVALYQTTVPFGVCRCSLFPEWWTLFSSEANFVIEVGRTIELYPERSIYKVTRQPQTRSLT